MKTETILNDSESHNLICSILSKMHVEGPISISDFETLSLIKRYKPEIFKIYEPKLISLMGLFYKTAKPHSLVEEVYSIYANSIETQTGKKFTPVQADAYKRIKEKTYFSFSAPTSAGKSYLFKELIQEAKKDIIIVVPSRALISEYISTILTLVHKSVLVLQFIEVINTKNTLRRIYIITPERGVELFKNINQLNIELFLFDEAQLSEDGIRGMKFDSFVRRTDKLLPKAKKVFTHPFVANPEAQLQKHNFQKNSDYKLYNQHSVGKIYLSHKDGIYTCFSPFEKGKKKPELISIDIVQEKLLQKATVLIYTTKAKIYDESILTEFNKYIELCPKLRDPKAKSYINKLKEFIGASEQDGEKHSTMISLMEKGIVVHHGSMPLKARLLIEDFVNNNFARICFSTSTLTQGINMPFDIVWIESFRFIGTKNQKALDLKNLIGRAGRSTSKLNNFDYGYVIIENENVKSFCARINDSSVLSNVSQLDQDLANVTEDLLDIVEAIKENSFNDELQLTNSQVERLEKAKIEKAIKYILDNLLINMKPITGKDYYLLKDSKRKKIKSAFEDIYISHLRRNKLTPGELSVLSASIPVLLWQIQGKSFSEIISLRYSFLSERDQRRKINSSLKRKEINARQARSKLQEIPIRFSAQAESLPNSKLSKGIPLFRNMNVTQIQYDRIVYDTYDYIDKVISLSLKDPISGAFLIYYEKTNDSRALSMSNYIKYGTNDSKEIWLIRYGFSFDEIEWIKNYVIHIDANEIIFSDSIYNLKEEEYKIIERFVN